MRPSLSSKRETHFWLLAAGVSTRRGGLESKVHVPCCHCPTELSIDRHNRLSTRRAIHRDGASGYLQTLNGLRPFPSAREHRNGQQAKIVCLRWRQPSGLMYFVRQGRQMLYFETREKKIFIMIDTIEIFKFLSRIEILKLVLKQIKHTNCEKIYSN
jgi:hypothetical protein